MAFRTSDLNELAHGFNANVEEDARILNELENRGRDLQAQMDRLEERWEKRKDKLERRQHCNIVLTYCWGDALA